MNDVSRLYLGDGGAGLALLRLREFDSKLGQGGGGIYKMPNMVRTLFMVDP